MIEVTKKDGWITIRSPDLQFFGKYNTCLRNLFTAAFSDGHASSQGWVDGRVILLRNGKILWTKDISRPNEAKVTPNGTVIVIDWIYKPDPHAKPVSHPEPGIHLGGTLLVLDSEGHTLLQRQFNYNLNDCNITSDAKICFVSTLAPDNTLYALDVAKGEILWAVKDRHASTGRIEIDEQRQLIRINERSGLGTIRTLDFSGRLAGESSVAAKQLQSVTGDQESTELIAGLLGSANKAIVLEALEKLKSILSRRKAKIDPAHLTPLLKQIYESGEEKLSDLAFDILLKFYERKLAVRQDTIDFLIRSIDTSHLDEKHLFRLNRIASVDADSLQSLMPNVLQCLESSPMWNERRHAAFVIGQVGKKRPDLVKDAIPTLISYIQHPEEIKQDVLRDPVAAMLGVDPKTWLKNACIYAIRGIGNADPHLVSEAKSLLEKLLR